MIAPLRKFSVQPPPLLADITVIERMWRAALAPGKKLPQYEDVVLGSLGRLADHLVLFEGDAAGTAFRVLRAGRRFATGSVSTSATKRSMICRAIARSRLAPS